MSFRIAVQTFLVGILALGFTGCDPVVLTVFTGASHTGHFNRHDRLSPARALARDFKVKGLYLTGWTVGGKDRLQHYVDLAEKTEINTYVVDIRDSDGSRVLKTPCFRRSGRSWRFRLRRESLGRTTMGRLG